MCSACCWWLNFCATSKIWSWEKKKLTVSTRFFNRSKRHFFQKKGFCGTYFIKKVLFRPSKSAPLSRLWRSLMLNFGLEVRKKVFFRSSKIWLASAPLSRLWRSLIFVPHAKFWARNKAKSVYDVIQQVRGQNFSQGGCFWGTFLEKRWFSIFEYMIPVTFQSCKGANLA